MDKEWYYSQGGENIGPFSSAEIRAEASKGKLRKDDLVWKPGMEEWIPAASIKGLYSLDASPPPISMNRSGTASAATYKEHQSSKNTVAGQAHQNARQIVEDVRKSFHLQRIVVFVAAVLGIASTLLPWTLIPGPLPPRMVLFGLQSDGWIIVYLFAPGIVFPRLGNRLAGLGKSESWILVASTGLAGLISIQRIIDPRSAFGLVSKIEPSMTFITHVGPYVCVIASILMCTTVFLLQSNSGSNEIVATSDQR